MDAFILKAKKVLECDPQALAQAMCKFIKQPELIAHMGARLW